MFLKCQRKNSIKFYNFKRTLTTLQPANQSFYQIQRHLKIRTRRRHKKVRKTLHYSNEKLKNFILYTNNMLKIYVKICLKNIFFTYTYKNLIVTQSLTAHGFRGKRIQTKYTLKAFARILVHSLRKLKIQSKEKIIIKRYRKHNKKYGRRYRRYRKITKLYKPYQLFFKSPKYKLKFFLKTLAVNHFSPQLCLDITPHAFNGCRLRKIVIKKKKKSVIKYLSYQQRAPKHLHH